MQDVRVVRGMGRSCSGHDVVSCKVRFVGIWNWGNTNSLKVMLSFARVRESSAMKTVMLSEYEIK